MTVPKPFGRPDHPDGRDHDREILRLAGPAFLALVAEPLFLLADAAIVGHLGTPELAGLGIAGAVIQTAVGLCIFLAYGTTASVARRIGAGDHRGALAQGVDGIWLALLIGVVTTVAGIATTGPVVDLFGADPEVTEQAGTYLRWAWLGVTPLLVVLATTGVLRGLQDTRTPLYAAVGGNLLNHTGLVVDHDITGIGINNIESVRDSASDEYKEGPSLDVFYLGFNLLDPLVGGYTERARTLPHLGLGELAEREHQLRQHLAG